MLESVDKTMKEILEEQITPVKIDGSKIAGYAMYRSPTQAKLVNIVAIDHSFEPLFVKYADMTIDEAAAMMEMIEQEQMKGNK